VKTSNIYERIIRKLIENLLTCEIPGKIPLEDLKKRLKIDKEGLINSVNILREILKIENEYLIVNATKVDIIEHCLRRGIYLDLERISRYISWQDFEELIKRFFREFEYDCIHKIRITVKNRRIEIDLIAYRENVLLLIDCKRYIRSRVRREIIEEHVRKVEDIAKNGVKDLLVRLPIGSRYFEFYLYPIVITVHDIPHDLVYGVPVVSIYKLRDFLYNFYYNRWSYRYFVVYRF